MVNADVSQGHTLKPANLGSALQFSKAVMLQTVLLPWAAEHLLRYMGLPSGPGARGSLWASRAGHVTAFISSVVDVIRQDHSVTT